MASTTNEPPPGSETIDLETLFVNGIDLQTADAVTIQKFVAHTVQQYADHNVEDYSLWEAIHFDFGEFTEDHLNKINTSSWTLLRDYCYMHGYWIDYNFGPGRTRTTTMLKALEAEWYDTWTLDQIKWVWSRYKTLSPHTLERKQELMQIGTNPSFQQQQGSGQLGFGQTGLEHIGLEHTGLGQTGLGQTGLG